MDREIRMFKSGIHEIWMPRQLNKVLTQLADFLLRFRQYRPVSVQISQQGSLKMRSIALDLHTQCRWAHEADFVGIISTRVKEASGALFLNEAWILFAFCVNKSDFVISALASSSIFTPAGSDACALIAHVILLFARHAGRVVFYFHLARLPLT